MKGTRGPLLLRVLLAVALLVPATVLFVQVWRDSGDKESVATRERHGVPYIAALTQLARVLSQAQAPTGGQGPASDSLATAVDAVAAADQQYGDDLLTHERWSDLRAKIQALPRGNGDPATVYPAYSVVGDLLLALYAKVDQTSALILDPQTDSYYVQAAAAIDVPQLIVQAGRLANQAAIAAAHPATTDSSLIDMAGTSAAALTAASRVVADLTSAGDATASTTLGSSMLTQVDRFQLAVQTLTSLTTATAMPTTVRQNLAQLQQARDDVASAAASLTGTALGQLDKLLAARISDGRPERQTALVAVAFAVLLALVPVIAALFGRRRRPAAPPPPVTTVEYTPDPLSDVDMRADLWRERSGAAR